jgi:hypothetical protein
LSVFSVSTSCKMPELPDLSKYLEMHFYLVSFLVLIFFLLQYF